MVDFKISNLDDFIKTFNKANTVTKNLLKKAFPQLYQQMSNKYQQATKVVNEAKQETQQALNTIFKDTKDIGTTLKQGVGKVANQATKQGNKALNLWRKAGTAARVTGNALSKTAGPVIGAGLTAANWNLPGSTTGTRLGDVASTLATLGGPVGVATGIVGGILMDQARRNQSGEQSEKDYQRWLKETEGGLDPRYLNLEGMTPQEYKAALQELQASNQELAQEQALTDAVAQRVANLQNQVDDYSSQLDNLPPVPQAVLNYSSASQPNIQSAVPTSLVNQGQNTVDKVIPKTNLSPVPGQSNASNYTNQIQLPENLANQYRNQSNFYMQNLINPQQVPQQGTAQDIVNEVPAIRGKEGEQVVAQDNTSDLLNRYIEAIQSQNQQKQALYEQQMAELKAAQDADARQNAVNSIVDALGAWGSREKAPIYYIGHDGSLRQINVQQPAQYTPRGTTTSNVDRYKQQLALQQKFSPMATSDGSNSTQAALQQMMVAEAMGKQYGVNPLMFMNPDVAKAYITNVVSKQEEGAQKRQTIPVQAQANLATGAQTIAGNLDKTDLEGQYSLQKQQLANAGNYRQAMFEQAMQNQRAQQDNETKIAIANAANQTQALIAQGKYNNALELMKMSNASDKEIALVKQQLDNNNPLGAMRVVAQLVSGAGNFQDPAEAQAYTENMLKTYFPQYAQALGLNNNTTSTVPNNSSGLTKSQYSWINQNR